MLMRLCRRHRDGSRNKRGRKTYAAGFEDKARSHKPRGIAGRYYLKKWPRCDSPLELRDGMQPYKHLDFSPVKLTSDF